jgi:hypothetical protein
MIPDVPVWLWQAKRRVQIADRVFDFRRCDAVHSLLPDELRDFSRSGMDIFLPGRYSRLQDQARAVILHFASAGYTRYRADDPGQFYQHNDRSGSLANPRTGRPAIVDLPSAA